MIRIPLRLAALALAAILLACGAGRASADARDPFEPNDAPEKAAPLALDRPVQATISPKGDHDWYAIDVPGPGILTITLDPVPDGVAPALLLRKPTGEELAHSTPREPLRVELRYEAPAAGKVLLLVQ